MVSVGATQGERQSLTLPTVHRPKGPRVVLRQAGRKESEVCSAPFEFVLWPGSPGTDNNTLRAGETDGYLGGDALSVGFSHLLGENNPMDHREAVKESGVRISGGLGKGSVAAVREKTNHPNVGVLRVCGVSDSLSTYRDMTCGIICGVPG